MPSVIAYHGGCYGSWLTWVLSYLTDPDMSDEWPMDSNGSAHKWGYLHDTHLGYVDDIKPVRPQSNIHQIHPTRTDHTGLIKNMQWLVDNFDRVVYVYTTDSSLFWIMNAKNDKVYDVKLEKYFNRNRDITEKWEFLFENHEEVLANWPEDHDEEGNLARWIVREYLSMILKDGVRNSLTIDSNDKVKYMDVLAIDVRDIRDDLEGTVTKILDYLGMESVRKDVDLTELQERWAETQPHLFKDELIKDIVESTIDGTEIDWPELSIVDEAMIQHLLRGHGYEIKCHGLNEFPTNSNHLRELIHATR